MSEENPTQPSENKPVIGAHGASSDNDYCEICHKKLIEVCAKCCSNNDTDVISCPVATGKCGHQFHSHCIQEWLKNNSNCPMPGCGERFAYRWTDEIYCAICRNKINEVCVECSNKHITDTSLCPTVTGKCGHILHSHCIQEWLKKYSTCPVPGDGSRWEPID